MIEHAHHPHRAGTAPDRPLTIVISQGQSRHPAKRAIEDELAAAAIGDHGLPVIVIDHLYDLNPDSDSFAALRQVAGDLIVASWLFPRAAHWVLDRHGIVGQYGQTLLDEEDATEDEEDDDEAADDESADTDADDKQRVIESRPPPARTIYCLNMNSRPTVQPFLDELQRIIATRAKPGDERNPPDHAIDLQQWLGGNASAESNARYLQPTNDTALDSRGRFASPTGAAATSNPALSLPVVAGEPMRINEQAGRRWYPVIDFSRCTNCMECIDFCLFGVYGVDRSETILVEQPDNCRKGCPACSRVCPENAIIFPQHKSPAIAGSSIESAGALKIDLSRLFGAPDGSEDAATIAARERDEQLLLAGREAVGLPKRQPATTTAAHPKDQLDSLLDILDECEL
jgi:NAD-dependent dihydropyrimidine dehydrogenase PreA subunit